MVLFNFIFHCISVIEFMSAGKRSNQPVTLWLLLYADCAWYCVIVIAIVLYLSFIYIGTYTIAVVVVSTTFVIIIVRFVVVLLYHDFIMYHSQWPI